MSAVSHSRHVCSATQQTCLPCDTAGVAAASHSMSAVWHSGHVCRVTQQTCPTLLASQNHGGMSQEGRGLCRKQMRWTLNDYLLPGLDTCLMPEAQNWTDLNYSL